AEQSARIVAAAREDAAAAAEQAKEDLKASVARRLQAALDQIASAEAGAVKEVRDTAISVAVAVAAEVLAKQMSATGANQLIDAAISEVEAKLH
ncbi:MAG: F-type H+-transporting ATPase subunit b, partial [Paracoccaceae bacterium]